MLFKQEHYVDPDEGKKRFAKVIADLEAGASPPEEEKIQAMIRETKPAPPSRPARLNRRPTRPIRGSNNNMGHQARWQAENENYQA